MSALEQLYQQIILDHSKHPHGVGPPVGRYDGGAGQFGHPADHVSGVAPLDTAAGQDDRALGGGQYCGGLVDQALVSPGPGLTRSVGVWGQQVKLDLGAGQQITGNVNHHRSHLSRRGHTEGVAKRLRQHLYLIDGEGCLGDWLEEGNLVELLGGAAVLVAPGCGWRQHDHRRVGHVGRRDTVGQVQHSGSVGHQAHAG